jgi:hypothetical protein
LCLTPGSQVSPTTITLESINRKTSITVVPLVMTFSNGTIHPKSGTVNLLTSPSEPLHENLVHVLEPTQTYHSLATETEYVRGKLVDHANDLLSLGTDGFRLDAAKRRSSLLALLRPSRPMTPFQTSLLTIFRQSSVACPGHPPMSLKRYEPSLGSSSAD